MLSRVALEDFPGQPIRGNDCWDYVSPSGREYALMGLYNEVAVVEVTSPSDPVVSKYSHDRNRLSCMTIRRTRMELKLAAALQNAAAYRQLRYHIGLLSLIYM